MQPNPKHRGDPLFLPDLLRAWGITVKELPGWRDWGHGDFGQIWGVIAHHTGANDTSAEFIARNPMLGNGLSSQIHISRAGVVTLCGAGIAWHAGKGAWPGIATDNANAVTIGIEAQSDGTSPWPPAELDAYRTTCAAICWYLGLSADRVIGHKEWAGPAQGKWDPGGIDMAAFRRDVQTLINRGPTTAPTVSKEELGMDQVKYLTDFIKGYLAPVISDVKDIREQLCGKGSRDSGQYKGWAQLGTNEKGQPLTVVDAIAALRTDVDALKGGK